MRCTRTLHTTLCSLVALSVAGCGPWAFDHKRQVARERFDQHKARFKFALAFEQFDHGQIDMAYKSISETLTLHPDDPAYLLLLAKIQLERGELASAAETLQQITYQGRAVPEHRYVAGLLAERYGRPAEALTHFDEARRLQPLNRDYLMAYVETLVHMECLDEAMTLVDQELNKFDGHWSLYALRGSILRRQGHLELAAAAFSQALIRQPEDHTLAEAKAMALYDAGLHTRAVSALRSVVAGAGGTAPAHVHRALGASSLEIGDTATARLHLREAAEQSGGDFIAWLLLARCELVQQNLGAALRAAEQAVAIAPEKRGTQSMLGYVYVQLGKWPEAVRCLEAAVRIDPEDGTALCLLGRASEASGAALRAQSYYAEALRSNPEDQLARHLLENLQGQAGQHEPRTEPRPVDQQTEDQ